MKDPLLFQQLSLYLMFIMAVFFLAQIGFLFVVTRLFLSSSCQTLCIKLKVVV